jgi:hypothetical protein
MPRGGEHKVRPYALLPKCRQVPKYRLALFQQETRQFASLQLSPLPI